MLAGGTGKPNAEEPVSGPGTKAEVAPGKPMLRLRSWGLGPTRRWTTQFVLVMSHCTGWNTALGAGKYVYSRGFSSGVNKKNSLLVRGGGL
jgi:hypothetical protein